MTKYYVNKKAQTNGMHEVHKEDCTYLIRIKDALYLGKYLNCESAVNAAEKFYPNIQACFFCSNECLQK